MMDADAAYWARLVRASAVEWQGRVGLHEAACIQGATDLVIEQRRMEALAAAEALLDVQAEAFRL